MPPLDRLIVFTRFPAAGRTKTRMIPLLGAEGAADLQRAMTEHLLRRLGGDDPGQGWEVEIRYAGAAAARVRAWLGTLPAEVAAYNCDLDIAAAYLYSRRVWPCAWYEVEAEDGRLLHLDPMEDAFAVEFSAPPLATLTLSLTRDRLIPLGAGNGLAVGCDGRTLELEAEDLPGLVRELARWLKRADPDLVLSDWGDEVIIPTVWRWSRKYSVPLPLDREPNPAPRRFGGGRSYFSYGRIVYQGSSAPFAGRWHLDRRNSFYYRESGLMGLIQIARIGQMPLQQAARSSPGTLITSMQLARAVAGGILIPWRKAEPEHFKTAAELLTIDKAARVLGVAPSTVHRWLSDGFIAGEQITPGAPWQIRMTEQLRARFVEDAPEGYVPMLEATRILGVSRQTVLQRVKRGDLAAVHVSRGKRKGLRIKALDNQPELFGSSS